MARSGKQGKTFGVKTASRGKAPASSSRTFGVKGGGDVKAFGVKVREVPAGNVQTCPRNCGGEYIEGTWVHSKTCPWSSVLWKSHGKTAADWNCPYGCPVQELPSGWTHQPFCAFWDRTGRTPFDHNAPHEVTHPQALPQGRASTKEEKWNWPEALEVEDDDLPF